MAMSFRDLYVVTRPLVFAGISARFSEAKFAVMGAPLDDTTSYRPGTRFAPNAIREASMNIESNGLLLPRAFIESVPLTDIGDIALSHGLTSENILRIERVVREVMVDGKKPVVIGGEHTVTLGVLRGLKSVGYRPCLVVFDAHFDLREEYLGNRLSHACVMRRVLEEGLAGRIVFVGVRAYSLEELLYADNNNNIEYFTSLDVTRLGPLNIASRIKNSLENCESLYVSVDIDGLDPSIAPGTGTPEPLGLSFLELLRILGGIIDSRIVGADLVEVNPLVDCGNITSITAARILQEILLLTNTREKTRSHKLS